VVDRGDVVMSWLPRITNVFRSDRLDQAWTTSSGFTSRLAAIHLSRCSRSELPTSLLFSNDLSAQTKPVMVLTGFNKKRIGKDYAEAFDRPNLVLVASRHSATARSLDAESRSTVSPASRRSCTRAR
jgi:hypothetical protein